MSGRPICAEKLGIDPSVVPNPQSQLSRVIMDFNFDAPGLCVPEGVSQRLACNSINSSLVMGRRSRGVPFTSMWNSGASSFDPPESACPREPIAQTMSLHLSKAADSTGTKRGFSAA